MTVSDRPRSSRQKCRVAQKELYKDAVAQYLHGRGNSCSTWRVTESHRNAFSECSSSKGASNIVAIYHTNSEGPDREALKYGMKAIIELAKKQNSIAYIATHNKSNVQAGFSDTFGWKNIQKFLKEGHMRIDGVNIYLQTERKKPQCYDTGPVLSPYNGLPFVSSLLEDKKNSDLVYIPWMSEERDEFLSEHKDSVEIYRGDYTDV